MEDGALVTILMQEEQNWAWQKTNRYYAVKLLYLSKNGKVRFDGNVLSRYITQKHPLYMWRVSQSIMCIPI